MDTIKSTVQAIALLVALGLIAYNIYTGATVSKIGIPPFFEIDFDPAKKPSESRPTHSTDTPEPKAGFRVIEALLRADPFSYEGQCPVTIKFSGRISTVGGSGTVSYKYLRSDNASAPVETATFSAPSSKDVSTSWTLGAPGMNFEGWQSIQVFEPQSFESAKAAFSIRCK